jgi:nitrate reductase (cytochrome), electron transfer subunit
MTGPNNFESHQKAAKVGLAVVLIVSISGYFVGLRQSANTASSRDLAGLVQPAVHAVPDAGHPSVPEVRNYRDMQEVPKANRAWSNTLSQLRQPEVDLFATNRITEAERAAAAEQRRARRAFDGAPPTVPHPVHQTSAASCLACHGEGKVIGGRVASKISHPPYSNCTQCHVPASGGLPEPGEFPALTAQLPGNAFLGLETFGPGTRAFPGAPPTIPHPTQMRNDCMSCHGPTGTATLRTSHPWRQSCTQCHVASGQLDLHSVPPGHPLGVEHAVQAFLQEGASR